ncbi:MAG: DUF2271 domain-containing protein [Armatimonadetes bacterium]|nr:DUF2271 domain-containing protein [Armatimonadota bacterium]
MNQETAPPHSRRSFLKQLGSLALMLAAPSLLAKAPAKKAAKWDIHYEALISLSIAEQEGFRTHRPYVAVWVEDANGKTIRTLSLWVQTERRGPKWIPDLRRWFRGEEDRRTADGGDMVTTISSATRQAGKYSLVWNGKNDKGALVDQGDYNICIEAVREHGTYQLIREKVSFGKKVFKQNFQGNQEIDGASVEFRKKA